MLIREKATQEDLIRAASYLDCEGSITLSRHVSKKGWHSTTIFCSIAQSDKRMVDYLLETFGGWIQAESPKKLSKKVIYRWKICSNDCVGFLEMILPYMRLKNRQANLAILFQQSRSALAISERDGFWLKMKALNKGEPLAETKRMDAETNPQSDSPTLTETSVSTMAF